MLELMVGILIIRGTHFQSDACRDTCTDTCESLILCRRKRLDTRFSALQSRPCTEPCPIRAACRPALRSLAFQCHRNSFDIWCIDLSAMSRNEDRHWRCMWGNCWRHSTYRAQIVAFHVSVVVDGRFGATFALLLIEVHPVMQAADGVIFDFVQKNMFETRATDFARYPWIRRKPDGLQQIEMGFGIGGDDTYSRRINESTAEYISTCQLVDAFAHSPFSWRNLIAVRITWVANTAFKNSFSSFRSIGETCSFTPASDS